MTPNALFYGRIDQKDLSLDTAELAARLRIKREDVASLSPLYEQEVREALSVGYVGLKTEISLFDEREVRLGEVAFQSQDLCRHLSGCREALLLGVTLGFAVDRLLRRKGALSVSEQFTADAYASAFAEAALKEALKQTGIGIQTSGFSPGYGDLSLEAQIPILEALSARERLSLTLTKALLMSPTKSITAIYGIA